MSHTLLLLSFFKWKFNLLKEMHLKSFSRTVKVTHCVNQIKGRTIRVDHVKDYRPPKDSEDIDDVTKILREEGCAPSAPAPSSSSEEKELNPVPAKKLKKGEVSFMSKVDYVIIHLSFIVNRSKITPVETLLGLVVQSVIPYEFLVVSLQCFMWGFLTKTLRFGLTSPNHACKVAAALKNPNPLS